MGDRAGLRALADDGHRIVHPRPAANVKFGDWTQSFGKGGVAAVHASNSAGVVFANDIVRALLAVRRQVVVGEVVAGQALVAGDSSALENREREAWQQPHTDLVQSRTCGGADGIVVRKLDMRDLFIPVVSELVADHCLHLGHRVVYTFHPIVAVWVIGVGGDFSSPEKLINGVRKLGAELEADIRKEAARAPPQRRTLGFDGVRVSWATETTRGTQDVGVSSRRHQERAESIDADSDARATAPCAPTVFVIGT